MEDQQAPTAEPRTDQELLRLFSEIATAYQIDKQLQENIDLRAHQLRVMTEQNRHDEAVRWISAVEAQRKEQFELMRHQFDRQFWLTVGFAAFALSLIAGLIFIKNNLTAAHVIFSLVVTFLAGRRSKDWFGLPGMRSLGDGNQPQPPQPKS